MLSRITRSRAQLAASNDENVPTAVVGAKAVGAGPVKMTGKRPQIDEVGKNKVALGTSVVGVLSNKIQRSALGDISNVGGLAEPAGKKPALKPAAPSSRLASLPVVVDLTTSLPIPVASNVQAPQAQMPIAQSHVPSSQHLMIPRHESHRSHEIVESKDDVEEVLDASISDADMDGDDHTNQTVQLESLLLQKPAQPQPTAVQPAPVNVHPSVHHSQLSPSLCAYDIANVNNAQAVTELAPIIMRHLKRSEVRHAVNPNYIASQTDINARMREILVDWLNEVHQKFKLRPETLYLTVIIIDKFLEKKIVSRSKLQLVGCTAMLLASKYEEVYAPEVRDFVYISDSAYTKEQILGMEAIMLSTLQFFLTIPSCFRFAERYWNVAQVTEQQLHLVNFFMELTLQDYNFLKFLPSKVAASALYLALKVTGAKWTPVLESHTEFREDDLWECAGEILNLAANENSKYRAVRKKYSSRRFLEVSTSIRFGNFQIPTSSPSSATSSSSLSSSTSSSQGGVSI